MDIDEVVVTAELWSPDPIEQVVSTDHDARISGERGQDIEFGRGKDNSVAPNGHGAPSGINDQVRIGRRRWCSAGTAQERLDRAARMA